MCRYAMYGPYKSHFACFGCRKAFKDVTRCPECREPMTNMGLDFAAPPKDRVDQWEKVRRLAGGGVLYHSCGDGGPGPRPARLRDVEEFLASVRASHEGVRLASKFRARRTGPRRARAVVTRRAHPRGQRTMFRAR